MSNEIVLLVERCQKCQERRPSQQKEPLLSDPLPSRPFEVVSADLFQVGRLHALVYCCRLSGWPVVYHWHHDPDAREVSHALTACFTDLGVPVRLNSDGGPQFDALFTQTMLKEWGVIWSPSSAHYPQANGHAEAAVKAAKDLVIKEATSGDLANDKFRQALLEFCNTPRVNGKSHAEIIFGHPLRSIVPVHRSVYAPQWKNAMEARDKQAELDASIKMRYDRSARKLKHLHIGTAVRIQDPFSKLWSHIGVVVSDGTAVNRPRSYRVKFASGSVLWRNRRHLRPMRAVASGKEEGSGGAKTCSSTSGGETSSSDAVPMTMPHTGGAAQRPRRSENSRRAPERFKDFEMKK